MTLPRATRMKEDKSKEELWKQYFHDVPLTDKRWIERCTHEYLEEALRITAEKDRSGRFAVRDEANIGKYLCGVFRNLKCGDAESIGTGADVITFPISVRRGYRFTASDQQRFKGFLCGDGDCLRWEGARTKDGYGRFSVNGRSEYAHVIAYFMQFDGAPATGQLDWQTLNVAHNCRNRDCCNPRHLRVTSKLVNLAERDYFGENDYQAQALGMTQ